MKYIFNILALTILVLSISCEKQEHIGIANNDGTVKITLRSAQMENVGATKSISQLPDEGCDTDYRVRDYWFIQYSSDGSIVGDAKYVEVTGTGDYQTPVLRPEGNNKYYCIFIANTHNPNLNLEFEGYKGTLAAMTQFYKNIESLEDTYNKDHEDIIMSGITTLGANDTELYCKLFRNIAKVTGQLKNNAG